MAEPPFLINTHPPEWIGAGKAYYDPKLSLLRIFLKDIFGRPASPAAGNGGRPAAYTRRWRSAFPAVEDCVVLAHAALTRRGGGASLGV